MDGDSVDPTGGGSLVVAVVALVVLAGLAGCVGGLGPGSGGDDGGANGEDENGDHGGTERTGTTTVPTVDPAELDDLGGKSVTTECPTTVTSLSVEEYGPRGVQVNGTYEYTGDDTAFGVSITVELIDENGAVVDEETLEQSTIRPGTTRNFSVPFVDERPSNFTRYEVEVTC